MSYSNDSHWKLGASAIYSTSSTVFQYIFPISILTFAHCRICHKLHNRFHSSESNNRRKNTHQLLSAIAYTFVFCWLPLNAFNIVADFYPTVRDDSNQQNMLIVYTVCHICGMLSTCINPLLYGWFNQNLRREMNGLVFNVFPSNHNTPISRETRMCTTVWRKYYIFAPINCRISAFTNTHTHIYIIDEYLNPLP